MRHSIVGCIGLDWVQIFLLAVGWVRLGQSDDGLGWIGSHKIKHGQLSEAGAVRTKRRTTRKRNNAASHKTSDSCMKMATRVLDDEEPE